MNNFARLVALALCASSIAVSAQQRVGGTQGMEMGSTAASGAAMAMTHQATGVVKKIDTKGGRVTLAHGPVKSLNWPAMEMGFEVNERALLDKLAVGQKVDFDFEKRGKGYVVTAIK